MKQLAHKSNEQGTTLIEILVCIIFLTIVIGPLTLNFTTAHKMLGSAQRMNKVIGYSEILMDQVQNRLTWDLAIKQAIEAHSIVKEKEYERYEYYIKDYLSQTGDKKVCRYLLENYLEEEELEQKYRTDDYSYEVFICPINKSVIEENKKFILSKETIEKSGATILCSDQVPYEMMEDTITFEIPSSTYKAFIDDTERYVPNEQLLQDYPILYIKLDQDGKIYTEGKSVLSVQDYKMSINNEQSIASTITITSTDRTSKVNLVKLDATALTDRGEDFNNKNYTLRVENNTGGHLVIKAIRSDRENKGSVDKRLRIISTVKDVIVEYIDEVVPEPNYLIALIIRDKHPLIGNKAKQVKKRVQIYSYDSMIQKGW